MSELFQLNGAPIILVLTFDLRWIHVLRLDDVLYTSMKPLDAHETSNELPFACWAIFKISSHATAFFQR